MQIIVKNSHRPLETATGLNPGDKTKVIDGVRVLYFYDKSLRLWTVYAIDEIGNQIGETTYANRRNDDLPSALESAARMLFD